MQALSNNEAPAQRSDGGAGASIDSQAASALLALPSEVLLLILEFLDVPDLLAMSRTCHALRPLPLDPILHRHRLAVAQSELAHSLRARPPLAALRPPCANIYLTRTLYVARQMNRRLVGINLDRRLRRRPPIRELVDRGVLPNGCFVLVPAYKTTSTPHKGHGEVQDELRASPGLIPSSTAESERSCDDSWSDQCGNEANHNEVRRSNSDEAWVRTTASPQLLSVRRALEREALKDKLRRFLLGKGLEEVKRRRREREMEREGVQVLARRFANREKRGGSREIEELRPRGWRVARTPARANVLRLRRFWEAAGG